jgi:hypothetical protein
VVYTTYRCAHTFPKSAQETPPDDSSASSSSGSDTSSSEDEGESSGVDREAVALKLLRDYVQSHTKTSKRLAEFLDCKGKKLTEAKVVKNYQFAISFLEKTKTKTDWPVRHLCR